jgi:hypothetical protein
MRERLGLTGVKHGLSGEELVRSLPDHMQGWLWAVFVDEGLCNLSVISL